jgi:ribonucleoside-diphosphate reductase alpha chain
MKGGTKYASNIKFYSDYARFMDEVGRTENWEDSVKRVMNMHRKKYAKELESNRELAAAIDFAEECYLEQKVLASQRALQWGGDPMLKHEAKMYNCLSTWVDRRHFFRECMYWLLCGCGTGFSVQFHHVAKLPSLKERDKEAKTFVIPDSHHIAFDYSLIRPKGSKITGGFKAPGPDGLRHSLSKIEELLTREVAGKGEVAWRPIVAYDVTMHMADAVLSGGVRRAATICLFSPDDTEMMNAKTGNWYMDNPQRARSNNSAMLVKNEVTREHWRAWVCIC